MVFFLETIILALEILVRPVKLCKWKVPLITTIKRGVEFVLFYHKSIDRVVNGVVASMFKVSQKNPKMVKSTIVYNALALLQTVKHLCKVRFLLRGIKKCF